MAICIYFLLTLEGKIIFSEEEPITTHTELIEINTLQENKVVRLIYDPYSNSMNKEIGIQYVDISCSAYCPPMPFKLKKNHLDAIEKFISKNEEIAEAYFEKEHARVLRG